MSESLAMRFTFFSPGHLLLLGVVALFVTKMILTVYLHRHLNPQNGGILPQHFVDWESAFSKLVEHNETYQDVLMSLMVTSKT